MGALQNIGECRTGVSPAVQLLDVAFKAEQCGPRRCPPIGGRLPAWKGIPNTADVPPESKRENLRTDWPARVGFPHWDQHPINKVVWVIGKQEPSRDSVWSLF